MDEDLELHHQILSVDYLGAMHTARAALPDMLARQSGHILFVGSLMAMYGAALPFCIHLHPKILISSSFCNQYWCVARESTSLTRFQLQDGSILLPALRWHSVG